MLSDCLLVIDMQQGVIWGNPSVDHATDLIEQINQRINEYRRARKRIIFIQHNDEDLERHSPDWQFISDLAIQPDDQIIEKTHPNSFYQTSLQDILNWSNVHSIEIAGAQSDFCINATIIMAHGLGYKLSMQHGASTTVGNQQMTAAETIQFFEHLWDQRYLEFIE